MPFGVTSDPPQASDTTVANSQSHLLFLVQKNLHRKTKRMFWH